MRDKLLKRYEAGEIASEVLEEAENEILNLMAKDSFATFKQSATGKEFMQRWNRLGSGISRTGTMGSVGVVVTNVDPIEMFTCITVFLCVKAKISDRLSDLLTTAAYLDPLISCLFSIISNKDAQENVHIRLLESAWSVSFCFFIQSCW